MLCYKLESDEVALFESDVSLKENKDKNVILITNHNIVIETTKKKMFKSLNFPCKFIQHLILSYIMTNRKLNKNLMMYLYLL